MNSIALKQQKVNTQAEDFFQQWYFTSLPNKPYCTNDLGSLRILPKDRASSFNYVQHNSIYTLSWLVYDVDRYSATYDWDDLHAPPPNFAVMNPSNGHAHLFYGLDRSINLHYTAKDSPIRFAASIDSALRQKLEADRSYGGLISKNPMVETWKTLYFQKNLYDLSWLADYIDIPTSKQGTDTAQAYSLGRNCSLFDLTRQWAYSAIRDTSYYNDYTRYFQAVNSFAQQQNLRAFNTPLHFREVHHIAKSVAKWTYKKLSKQGFKAWGDRRRAASLAVRKEAAQDRAALILDYKAKNPQLSGRQIAKDLGVAEYTVRQAFKQQKTLDP